MRLLQYVGVLAAVTSCASILGYKDYTEEAAVDAGSSGDVDAGDDARANDGSTGGGGTGGGGSGGSGGAGGGGGGGGGTSTGQACTSTLSPQPTTCIDYESEPLGQYKCTDSSSLSACTIEAAPGHGQVLRVAYSQSSSDFYAYYLPDVTKSDIEWSFDVWIDAVDPAGAPVVFAALAPDGTTHLMALALLAGTLRYQYGTGGSWNSASGTFALKTWHHVDVTWTGAPTARTITLTVDTDAPIRFASTSGVGPHAQARLGVSNQHAPSGTTLNTVTVRFDNLGFTER